MTKLGNILLAILFVAAIAGGLQGWSAWQTNQVKQPIIRDLRVAKVMVEDVDAKIKAGGITYGEILRVIDDRVRDIDKHILNARELDGKTVPEAIAGAIAYLQSCQDLLRATKKVLNAKLQASVSLKTVENLADIEQDRYGYAADALRKAQAESDSDVEEIDAAKIQLSLQKSLLSIRVKAAALHFPPGELLQPKDIEGLMFATEPLDAAI